MYDVYMVCGGYICDTVNKCTIMNGNYILINKVKMLYISMYSSHCVFSFLLFAQLHSLQGGLKVVSPSCKFHVK